MCGEWLSGASTPPTIRFPDSMESNASSLGSSRGTPGDKSYMFEIFIFENGLLVPTNLILQEKRLSQYLNKFALLIKKDTSSVNEVMNTFV